AGAAVGYCNVAQAAAAIVQAFRPADAKRALGNTALAQRSFGFDDYVAVIVAQLTTAAALRADAARATGEILDSGLFDFAFHDNAPHNDGRSTRAAVRAYVARGQKGLVRYNPRPGFNEGVARSRMSQPGPALMTPHSAATHRCVVLPDTPVRMTGPALRAAVHLHLHYPELAEEFVALLASARQRPGVRSAPAPLDIVVTTTSDRRRLEIEYAFRAYTPGTVRVLVGPNRGRDIGPFLTDAGRLLRDGGYDVVGHLHGKRSLAVDAAMGDRWRSYLMGTLLGGAAGLSGIFDLFARDPLLGLVFAEDRHCVGWGKNKPFAAGLAGRLQPPAAVPDWPIFPIGTMFWARPAAVLPLWSSGFVSQDFPAEPLPYDGTVLHAIERMLPSVCEATGHGWCTVYRKGAGW
ncbi:MAG: hypothetical protein H7Z10_08730, partial [Gemmatimonadaceae bacterium]|nr:hypothetical protein [Acetobacteraceae bacterium]